VKLEKNKGRRMQGDWNALGEVLYRKIPVYQMKWKGNDNIDDYLICGAPFGGPLAMIRDDKKLVPLSEENMNPKLRIFTSSGNLIAEVSGLHLDRSITRWLVD
jgi:vacuolar protein sorting-associated protein 16